MGVFDKIKNALFEVEYVEVDEKPKKAKKAKPSHKERKVKEEEKPIVKKIVLPEKKDEKVEKIEEEELKDDNFELRPKNEITKEKPKDSFKFMDDDDFKVSEPEIIGVYDNDDDPFVEVEKKDYRDNVTEKKEVQHHNEVDNYNRSSNFNVSHSNNLDSHKSKSKKSRPYGVDDSYAVNVHEYGTYENKDEKVYFKPSPIISPIYGVLDKNYKKEDVVSKKDIRITSNYSRKNVNVDDIRNKAFGRRGDNTSDIDDNSTFEIDEEEDNVLVDLSDEKEKPEVKEVTVGDAMEYFQDLGLEYNVDYKDTSKEKTIKKTNGDNLENDIEKQATGEIKVNEVKDAIKEEKPKKKVVTESKSDDDNLFDLIDSMYKEDN